MNELPIDPEFADVLRKFRRVRFGIKIKTQNVAPWVERNAPVRTVFKIGLLDANVVIDKPALQYEDRWHLPPGKGLLKRETVVELDLFHCVVPAMCNTLALNLFHDRFCPRILVPGPWLFRGVTEPAKWLLAGSGGLFSFGFHRAPYAEQRGYRSSAAIRFGCGTARSRRKTITSRGFPAISAIATDMPAPTTKIGTSRLPAFRTVQFS